jgi:hypothetical protein
VRNDFAAPSAGVGVARPDLFYKSFAALADRFAQGRTLGGRFGIVPEQGAEALPFCCEMSLLAAELALDHLQGMHGHPRLVALRAARSSKNILLEKATHGFE